MMQPPWRLKTGRSKQGASPVSSLASSRPGLPAPRTIYISQYWKLDKGTAILIKLKNSQFLENVSQCSLTAGKLVGLQPLKRNATVKRGAVVRDRSGMIRNPNSVKEKRRDSQPCKRCDSPRRSHQVACFESRWPVSLDRYQRWQGVWDGAIEKSIQWQCFGGVAKCCWLRDIDGGDGFERQLLSKQSYWWEINSMFGGNKNEIGSCWCFMLEMRAKYCCEKSQLAQLTREGQGFRDSASHC